MSVDFGLQPVSVDFSLQPVSVANQLQPVETSCNQVTGLELSSDVGITDYYDDSVLNYVTKMTRNYLR